MAGNVKSRLKRIEKAEKALNVNQEHKTVTVVMFGGTLPPDRTEGDTTIHFVMYDESCGEKEK